jgi:hypothetical protein
MAGGKLFIDGFRPLIFCVLENIKKGNQKVAFLYNNVSLFNSYLKRNWGDPSGRPLCAVSKVRVIKSWTGF